MAKERLTIELSKLFFFMGNDKLNSKEFLSEKAMYFYFFRNSFGSIPASLRMALSVPSGISPE